MFLSKKEARVLMDKGLIKKEVYDSIPDDGSENLSHKQYNSGNRKYGNGGRHQGKAPFQESEKKPLKYRNVKVYVFEDGVSSDDKKLEGHGKVEMTFDSKKEFDRWNMLSMLERSGAISELERQKKFVLQEGYTLCGKKVAPIVYVADFYYLNNRDGNYVIEDVKPFDKKTNKYRVTKDFALKKKLLEYRYCLNKNCVFLLY